MPKPETKHSAKDHARLPEEEFQERLAELLRKHDYAGVAALKAQQGDDDEGDEDESAGEESVASSQENANTDSTRVLRMLYKGTAQEVARKEETARKSKVFNGKHGY